MSEKEKLSDKLEGFDRVDLYVATDQVSLVSIAISLKRMADILAEAWEKEKKSP